MRLKTIGAPGLVLLASVTKAIKIVTGFSNNNDPMVCMEVIWGPTPDPKLALLSD